MLVEKITTLEWDGSNPLFLREVTGRFDIVCVPDSGYWVALDWDYGKCYRSTKTDCAVWCEKRAAEAGPWKSSNAAGVACTSPDAARATG